MCRNVRLVRLIRTFMIGGAVIVPGLPPFLENAGTSIFVMELWFAIGMLATLLPSGILASRIGDKPVLIAGSTLMLAGPLLYIIGDSIFIYTIAELCIGAGLGCIFGSDESLLHDSTSKKGGRGDYSRQFGWTVLLQVLFVAFCFYLGGISYRIHPRIPFVIAVINYSVVLFASLKIESNKLRPVASDWNGLYKTLRSSAGLCWIIAVYASFLAIIRVSFWGYEKFFVESASPFNHGTVMAIGALISALVIWQGTRIRSRCSLPWLTAGIGLCFAASLVCMGAFVAPWCFALVFVQQVASSFVQNTYASELHSYIDRSSQGLRAAIVSFRQMMFLLCYMLVIGVVHFYQDLQMAEILFRLGLLALVSSLLLVVLSAKVSGINLDRDFSE